MKRLCSFVLNLRVFNTIFLFLILVWQTTGQTTNACHKSTVGREFWLGFMENRNYDTNHYDEITLSSSNTCNYSIYIGKSTTPAYSGTLIPLTPLPIKIDWKLIEATNSEEVQSRAIHVVSDNPLNLYAMNWSTNSADAALIYPIESLGKEYYAMCYEPHVSYPKNSVDATGKNSEFLVVASEDNTQVTITPTKVTVGNRPANVPFEVTLNKGELIQIQSENAVGSNQLGQGDLTGSLIKSNKPVAVYSGVYATTVPATNTACCYDHLYEQIPPIQTWGRKFVAVPLKARAIDYYRVLAANDLTAVKIGNQPVITLNKGQFYEFTLTQDNPSLIESDKPVLLAQYCASNSVDRPAGVQQSNWDGDPFMVIVNPVNQTQQKVAFYAYDSKQITTNYYVNIVIAKEAVGKVNLDGTPVVFTILGNSGYAYSQTSITKGPHILESSLEKSGFIAYVYGYGGVESYGYGVGFNLDLVLDLGSNLNAGEGQKMLVRCFDGPPLTINAGNGFDSYQWNTGETTSTISASKEGIYSVTARTNEGCELTDQIELKVSKPTFDLGPDQYICKPQSTVLDATNQFQFYNWSNGVKTATNEVWNNGDYSVIVTDKFGCKGSDTVHVTFVDPPKIDFSKLDTLICGSKNATLAVSSDKGNFSVERMLDHKTYSNLNIDVPQYGEFPFLIKTTDQYACSSDSLISFGFHKTPSVGLTIDSTTCYHYNLNVKYVGDAAENTSRFTWIFGADTIASAIGLSSYTVPLGINRTSRDLKLNVNDMGCENHVYMRDIKVIPNLDMGVSKPIGCEPFTAQFNSNVTEKVTYRWDFGDNTQQEGNFPNPQHTYQKFGFYAVGLKITSEKGCTNETKVDSLVHVAPIPSIGFTPFPTPCLPLGKNEVSYSGTANDKDTYLWDLKNLQSDEILSDPGKTQGPLSFSLIHKPETSIGLKVVTEFGCQSTDGILAVKRVPYFSASVDPGIGCIPLEANFVAKIEDPIDKPLFTWGFGDGNQGKGSTTKNNYIVADKKYDVVLTTESLLTGCKESLTYPSMVTTHPFPIAKFIVDHPTVYIDLPTVKFTNQSEGATSYSWDFGDMTASSDLDPTHNYTKVGHDKVVLTATNEEMCSDTVSSEVTIAMNKIYPPNAFSPNSPKEIDRTFRIHSEGVAPTGYTLKILNRWNELIHENHDPLGGWNGGTNDGKMAPAGVYIWVLSYVDYLGRHHSQTGTVVLVY